MPFAYVLQNLDVSAPHTVRVKGPATKWFSADGINQTHRLAPGIATTVQVGAFEATDGVSCWQQRSTQQRQLQDDHCKASSRTIYL
jgi:hypothetical protein